MLLEEMYLLRLEMTYSMLFLECAEERILVLLFFGLWILGVDLNYCNYCILKIVNNHAAHTLNDLFISRNFYRKDCTSWIFISRAIYLCGSFSLLVYSMVRVRFKRILFVFAFQLVVCTFFFYLYLYDYAPVVVQEGGAAPAYLSSEEAASDVRQFVAYYFGQKWGYPLVHFLATQIFHYLAGFLYIFANYLAHQLSDPFLALHNDSVVIDIAVLLEEGDGRVEGGSVDDIGVKLGGRWGTLRRIQSDSDKYIKIIQNLKMEDSRDIEFPPVENGFATSIGLLGPHSRLVCNINVQDKTTRYYKTRKQVVQTLMGLRDKLKRWAFQKLKNKARQQNGDFCGEFLPGELLRGNNKVIPQFLRRLKNQRVESYIKFRWQEKQIPPRLVKKLIITVSKLIDRRRKHSFRRITEFSSCNRKVKHGQNASQNDKMADTSVRSLSGWFLSTPDRSRTTARSLNVTLIKVNLTPQKVKQRSFKREGQMAREGCISIRELERSQQRKEYRFSSADSRWKRVRVDHSVHKI